MKVKGSLALIAAAAMLSACVSSPQPRSVPVAQQQPQGVEGTWADPNGIVSTFQAGTFNTRSTDNNALLASGTYTQTAPNLIEINMTSIVRQKQSRVNCALINPNQLNCTADSGSQFSLMRRT
ncbi:hypothetical protein MUU53_16725 [Rhizobium lemnae]|uniref:Outer membrane lipoprotein Omp10 n=1 Tax=Rhizobium lemnae TaxID=1214924 RepID=A0ABV8E7Q9_9HYPH|nr:outer membrane lipoprotein Omp10 [Rhizobium lemnae]MCJ8509552.1 hypothetical protein [Rhizobium lemnae]